MFQTGICFNHHIYSNKYPLYYCNKFSTLYYRNKGWPNVMILVSGNQNTHFFYCFVPSMSFVDFRIAILWGVYFNKYGMIETSRENSKLPLVLSKTLVCAHVILIQVNERAIIKKNRLFHIMSNIHHDYVI